MIIHNLRCDLYVYTYLLENFPSIDKNVLAAVAVSRIHEDTDYVKSIAYLYFFPDLKDDVSDVISLVERVREHFKKKMPKRKVVTDTKPLSTNTSGLRGIAYNKQIGKFTAQITVEGKRYHLGVFTDKEQAAAAYWDAVEKYRNKTDDQ